MRLHLQLLLLLALGVFGLHAGPFSNQHMISPKSYLDVLRPASQQDFSPAAVTSSQPSGASRGPGLLTAVSRAANPARLAPPYVVCVSSWAPMVRCIPGADQSEYQGKRDGDMHAPLSMLMVVTLLTALLAPFPAARLPDRALQDGCCRGGSTHQLALAWQQHSLTLQLSIPHAKPSTGPLKTQHVLRVTARALHMP